MGADGPQWFLDRHLALTARRPMKARLIDSRVFEFPDRGSASAQPVVFRAPRLSRAQPSWW